MKSMTCSMLMALAVLNVNAAEFCVTNSQQFEDALTDARNNGQDDVIKVGTGTYFGGFSYLGAEDYDLIISGGWSDFFGNPCGQQIDNPYATVLDGNSSERVLLIQAYLDSDITVSDLSFINGDANPASSGGLAIGPFENYVGDVLVERTAFINNKGHFNSAMSTGRGNKVTVRNSLFAFNQNTTGDGTVELLNDQALGVFFNNNTVVFNTSLDSDEFVHSGLRGLVLGSSGLFVANNLFWGNDGRDAFVSETSGLGYLYNNNINNYFGAVTVIANNFSAEPQFESGFLNFVPALGSQEVNQGRNPPVFLPVPTPFNMQWEAGSTDFYGSPRIMGGRVDVGAFEAAAEVPIFSDGFEAN